MYFGKRWREWRRKIIDLVFLSSCVVGKLDCVASIHNIKVNLCIKDPWQVVFAGNVQGIKVKICQISYLQS